MAFDLKYLAGSADDLFIAGSRLTQAQQRKTAAGKKGAPAPDAGDIMPTLEKIDGVSSKVIMGGFIGGGVLSALAGMFNWSGKKLEGKAGGQALKNVAGGLERVGSITFAEIPVVGGFVRTVGDVAMSGVGVLTNMLHSVGLTDKLAAHHEGKFAARSAQVAAHAEALFAAPAPAAVAEQMTELKGMVQSHLASPHAFEHEKFTAKVAAVVDESRKTAGPEGAKFRTALGKLEKLVGKSYDSALMTDNWKNLSGHTSAAAGRIAESGVLHGAMQTGILVGTGISAFRTGHDLNKALTNLRDMYADITHHRPEDVSGAKLMFGKVPDSVAQARAQIFKEFGPAVVLEAANTVLNISWVARNKGSMILLMAAGMGSQMLRGVLAGNILPTYAGIKASQKAGEPVPPEAYANLLGETMKELRERGGAESNFAKAMGAVYADNQVKVAEVLRDVESGKAQRVLDELKAADAEARKQHEAQKKADAEAAPKPAHATHSAEAAHDTTHVDRLHHKPAHTQHKPKNHEVIGKHTKQLHHQNNAASAQQEVGGV